MSYNHNVQSSLDCALLVSVLLQDDRNHLYLLPLEPGAAQPGLALMTTYWLPCEHDGSRHGHTGLPSPVHMGTSPQPNALWPLWGEFAVLSKEHSSSNTSLSKADFSSPKRKHLLWKTLHQVQTNNLWGWGKDKTVLLCMKARALILTHAPEATSTSGTFSWTCSNLVLTNRQQRLTIDIHRSVHLHKLCTSQQ